MQIQSSYHKFAWSLLNTQFSPQMFGWCDMNNSTLIKCAHFCLPLKKKFEDMCSCTLHLYLTNKQTDQFFTSISKFTLMYLESLCVLAFQWTLAIRDILQQMGAFTHFKSQLSKAFSQFQAACFEQYFNDQYIELVKVIILISTKNRKIVLLLIDRFGR